MIAGDLEIRIAAVYDQLSSDLKAAEQASARSGGAAGDGYGKGFEKGIKGYLQRTADQIQMQLGKAFQATNIARTFAAGLEEGAKGANFGDVIVNTVKSLPLIGTLASMIESGISIGLGTAEQEAKLAAARIREAEATQALTQVQKRDEEVTRQKYQNEMEEALRVEDRRKAAQIKARMEFHEIEVRKAADLENAKSESERRSIVERSVLEFEATRKRLEDQYRTIDEAEAEAESKRQEAAQKKADDERRFYEDLYEYLDKQEQKMAEDERKMWEDIADYVDEISKKAEKRIEDLRKQAQDIEKERADVASQVGTVSTSFGTFRFSPYTEQEKKQIDREMVAKLTAIAADIAKLAANPGSIMAGQGGIF